MDAPCPRPRCPTEIHDSEPVRERADTAAAFDELMRVRGERAPQGNERRPE